MAAPIPRAAVSDFSSFGTISPRYVILALNCFCIARQRRSALQVILPTTSCRANGRIDSILASLLGVARERIVVTADRLGNTGSAGIWLALAQLRPTLKPGQTVLALGAEATDFMFGGFRYCHG